MHSRTLLTSLLCVIGIALNTDAMCASGPKASYPTHVPEHVMSKCVGIASKTFNIPPIVIRALQAQEGGKIGTISRNDNGSFDLGPMQINTINLPSIKKAFPFLTWRHIVYDPCINIMVGTWFLRQKIDGRNGNVWEGVGDYHSKTPSKRIIYLRSYLNHYTRLDETSNSKPPKYLAATN